MIIRSDQDKFRAIEELKNLDMDKVWRVEVKPYKKNRSLAANNLMWLWLGVIGDYNGDDAADLHIFFKIKFLGMTTHKVMGTIIAEPKSTADLNTKEFTSYLNELDRFASMELGIVLPHPDDYDEAMGVKR